MGNFIIIEIGCLECGIPSSLVGRFDNLEMATEFANKLNDACGTDVAYEIFNINEIEEPIK